jgi:hypothetical protein
MSEYNFSYDDLDSMIDSASKDFDFSNYFSDSGPAFDFGTLDPSAFSYNDLEGMLAGGVDFDSIAKLGIGDFDLGNADLGAVLNSGNVDLDAIANLGIGDFDLGNLAESVGDFDQMAPTSATPLSIADSSIGSLADIDFDSLHTEGMTPEQLLYRQEMLDLGGQNFGSSVDMGKAMDDFNANLQGIYEKGGFTSQWQDVDGRKVQVYDDGTGMAVNPTTGASRSLSENEVMSLIKGGKLNTAASGYNAATGGTKTAPGGGVSVVLKDGTTGTLMSNGRVVDNSGTVVGTDKDVGRVITNTGTGTTTTTTTTTPPRTTTPATTTRPTTQQSGLGSLLPLLLALLAMNKGGGGGGESRGAVIPGLTATQRQTPYAQQQRAPGYRPGQGGITYFDQTQYAPRMAAGGGIARLLDGPGDGVSDSIPAVIEDEGMAGGGQPAKLARGEYVIDARTVAALGNGSTDAGAERLDKMRKNILRDDRKAGVGKDSKAHRHLLA